MGSPLESSKSYVENAVPGRTEEHTGQAQYSTGFGFRRNFRWGCDEEWGNEMRRAKIAAIVGVILAACTLQIVAQENASGPELTVQLVGTRLLSRQ